MELIIALLGAVIVQLIKYSNRKNKSPIEWLKSNIEEIGTSFLSTLVLCFIASASGAINYFYTLLPKILQNMPVELFTYLLYLIIGLGGFPIIKFAYNGIPALLNKLKTRITKNK